MLRRAFVEESDGEGSRKVSMTRSIVFANRKGGCGKTTTAVNVAHTLAMASNRVLLVDVDPQAHATLSIGMALGRDEPGISHCLNQWAEVEEVVKATRVEGLYLIPSSRELTSYEIELSWRGGSEARLAEQLSSLAGSFDYLLFDPPPTVGLLTVSCLVAAREVYIPMPMHFLAMEGLAEMMRLIYTVNATWSPNLRLKGIIPTFFNKNTRLAREILEDIAKNFGEEKLLPGIRTNVSLAEAPGHGKSVFEYAPQSAGAKDYRRLAAMIHAAGEE